MSTTLSFLIVDGYPRESRDKFEEIGMKLAGELYREMLLKYLPLARTETWFPSDPDSRPPTRSELTEYTGILWPGCNLTIYHHDDPRVTSQIEVARMSYEVGAQSFGSCWGIQMAVVAAGGVVGPNDKGREMGIGRQIEVTEGGRQHPMFEGKPPVYHHFVSHEDEVKELPPGAVLLAGNSFSAVQAVAVSIGKANFWGVQYHPEYDLHEMARLISAREERLTSQGFFRGHEDMQAYVDMMEALAAEPNRKDLRWQLGIDDDVLDERIRQREFVNWLEKQVLPGVGISARVPYYG